VADRGISRAYGDATYTYTPNGELLAKTNPERSGTGLRYSVEWRSETSISLVLPGSPQPRVFRPPSRARVDGGSLFPGLAPWAQNSVKLIRV
jgi:hypothetical protein